MASNAAPACLVFCGAELCHSREDMSQADCTDAEQSKDRFRIPEGQSLMHP